MQSESAWMPVYRAAMRVAPILAAPAFCLHTRGRARLGERFGAWGEIPPSFLWFHGASVGEVNGLLPIISALQARGTRDQVLLSATSATGLDAAAAKVPLTRVLPFDAPYWIKKALGNSRPTAFVFGETELWPALLHELYEKKIPIALVNGRISDRTYTRYLKLRRFFAPTIERISLICVQNQQAQERFLSLGARQERVIITGSAKYDAEPVIQDPSAITELRAQFFKDNRPIVVLGSLRPGEEEEWFPAIRASLDTNQSALGVIVAPRHREKFDFFAEQLQAHGIPYRRRSVSDQRHTSEAVVLLDSMGELSKVYACATLAFIGGTIRDYGGHNPLEPAPWGAAIAIGPYYQNAADVVGLLRESNALVEVRTRHEIEALLRRAITMDAGLAESGRRAQQFWRTQRGAVSRVISALEQQGITTPQEIVRRA